MSLTMSELASKFTAASSKVKPTSEAQLKTLGNVGVGIVKREIQKIHAVDTGTMLNSTTSERVSPTEMLIGPTVHYAAYVALGTSRMAARPFHVSAAQVLNSQAESLGFTPEDLGL